MAERQQGIISASIITLVIVAMAIGAGTGLIADAVGLGTRGIALVSGFVATIVASIARYTLVFMGAGAGADDRRVPMVVIVSAAVASIAGSLAAHDIAGSQFGLQVPALLGMFAGLLSAVLMAMLMITYHTNPRPSVDRG